MSKLGNQDIRVNLEQTESVTCDKCGGKVFEQAFVFQKVSPLLTGTGQPGLVPIPVFRCVECGHINEEFIPAELKGSFNSNEK